MSSVSSCPEFVTETNPLPHLNPHLKRNSLPMMAVPRATIAPVSRASSVSISVEIRPVTLCASMVPKLTSALSIFKASVTSTPPLAAGLMYWVGGVAAAPCMTVD